MKRNYFYINSGNVLVQKGSILRVDDLDRGFIYYNVNDIRDGQYDRVADVEPLVPQDSDTRKYEEIFSFHELEDMAQAKSVVVFNS